MLFVLCRCIAALASRIASESLQVSLARRGLALLLEKGTIKEVSKHNSIAIYTRATAGAE